MRAVLVAGLLAVFLVPTTLAAPAPSYFPLVPGSTWARRTYNGTLLTAMIVGEKKVGAIRCTIIETKAVRRDVQTVSRVCYEATPTVVRVIETQSSSGTSVFQPPRTMLTLPPRAGQTWSWAPKNDKLGVASTDAWVREETVTVPAGTFKAWKLKTVTRRGSDTVTAFTWYTRGVGVVRTALQTRRGSAKPHEDGSGLVNYTIP